MKIAVVGSRSFSDYSYLKRNLISFIANYNNQGTTIFELVSGGAKGADTLAEKFAVENNIPFKIFIAEWDRYGRSAGYERNKLIVGYSDIILAFWDQESKGTKHTIDLATKYCKPVFIFTDWKE